MNCKLALFLVISSVAIVLPLFSEEVRTTHETGKDGEEITTIYYKNDSRNIEKTVQYGKPPKYRLIQDFYEKDNIKHFDHEDAFDVEMGVVGFPNGKPARVVTYLKDSPDKMVKWTRTLVDSTWFDEYQYTEGAVGGLTSSENTTSLDNKTLLSEVHFYADTNDNANHIKKQSWAYNIYGDVIAILTDYYSTEVHHMIRQSRLYVPKKFSYKDSLPFKVATNYEDEPNGLLRIEEQYVDKGTKISNQILDPKKDEYGAEQKTYFVKNNRVVKSIFKFAIPRFKNVKVEITDVQPDGKILMTYFDPEGKEVFLDK